MTADGTEPGRAGPQRDTRVVPVYATTGGRARSAGPDLPMETLVTAGGRHAAGLNREYRLIVELAARPVSLVEVGAHLEVPVGVARVLVGDLADSGHLVVHQPDVDVDGRPTAATLTRLLEGLRAR